jgi:hypothetical protein
MVGRRLLALSAIALALGCEDHRSPTAPRVSSDLSNLVSDGAHGGNRDFFFLPPMVPNPVNDPNFEAGKFNGTLASSLVVEICRLQGSPIDAQGLPVATDCVAEPPVKRFPPGSVRLLGDADRFYQVLWNTKESNLDVTQYYRIRVLVNGSSVPFGVADVDPIANMKELRNARTGEVIPLNDDSTLPIKFRIEKGGGPTLCGDSPICTSTTVTNDNPNGDVQVVQAQGNNGPIAGVVLPDGWLPADGPQSVVITISSVNTGINDVAAGTQSSPCHAGLQLEQFNGCFKFTTTPALDPIDEGGDQFARAVTVVACYVLHDTPDPREPWAQLWSSGPYEAPHPLASASDVLVLTAPTEHACGTNFQTVVVIGSNTSGANSLTRLASASWRALAGGLERLVGVKTAYAVDLGLGGLTRGFSNVGPAITAEIQRYTDTGLTLDGGSTTTSTARIVGTRVHNGGVLTTGIGGLPVTFTVAAGNGTLQGLGSEAAPASTVTVITNTNPIDASPTSGGGFAPVNWTLPDTAGTYTLTAKGPALGGPVTFTATVPGVVIGFNFLPGSLTTSN